MSSMDSNNDHTGGTDVAHEPPYYYSSIAQTIPEPSHHNVPGYPQLTIQTSHLPQPQSPPGTYGAHYQHNMRGAYPPSRDYRYSYEQLSYTSPTMAGPPQAVFSPVLQPPHHDYFHRPPNQLFYPEYVTSPTTAAHPPTSGVYYAAPPQPITWNAPINPSVAHIQSPVNTTGGFKRHSSQVCAKCHVIIAVTLKTIETGFRHSFDSQPSISARNEHYASTNSSKHGLTKPIHLATGQSTDAFTLQVGTASSTWPTFGSRTIFRQRWSSGLAYSQSSP